MKLIFLVSVFRENVRAPLHTELTACLTSSLMLFYGAAISEPLSLIFCYALELLFFFYLCSAIGPNFTAVTYLFNQTRLTSPVTVIQISQPDELMKGESTR